MLKQSWQSHFGLQQTKHFYVSSKVSPLTKIYRRSTTKCSGVQMWRVGSATNNIPPPDKSQVRSHLYGIWVLFPSAKAAMTLPRAERDLLMFCASFRTSPSAPVLLTWEKIRELVKRTSSGTHEPLSFNSTMPNPLGITQDWKKKLSYLYFLPWICSMSYNTNC